MFDTNSVKSRENEQTYTSGESLAHVKIMLSVSGSVVAILLATLVVIVQEMSGSQQNGNENTVLNSTASLQNMKRGLWSCEAWLPPGIWTPRVGYKANTSACTRLQTQSNHSIWETSAIEQDTWFARSKILDVYPKLLMAHKDTQISIKGLFLEAPMRCQVIPRLGKASSWSEVNVSSGSLASCEISGDEGMATLVVQWDSRCKIQFDIEFVYEPIIWSIQPAILPPLGSSSFALHLYSGQPNLEDSITMFLPKKVNPWIKFECLNYESIHQADFVLLADDDWMINMTLLNISQSLLPGVCNLSLSLNQRDFFSTNQSVGIQKPEVEFLFEELPMVNGEMNKIWVKLTRPLSLPVSISLGLIFPKSQKNISDLVRLRRPIVHWNPGEIHPKAFILRIKDQAHKIKFKGKLKDPVNCGINPEDSKVKLITIERKNLPVFYIQTQKVMYPGEVDSFTVDLILLSGKNSLNSVLEYTLLTRQLNSGLKTDLDPEFLRETSGRIQWKAGDERRPLPIHINWENITFCDELEVVVVLKGVRMALVKSEENSVARIYGTPKNFCPPGTVTNHQETGMESNTENQFLNDSLTEIKIEGLHVKNDGYYETELIPSFIPTHYNYTAMIPYDMKERKMKLVSKGTPYDVVVQDESCSVRPMLNWEETLQDSFESEIIMNPAVQCCSLQVLDFSENEGFMERELEESTRVDLAPAAEELEEDSMTVFHIHFLQLSDPHFARLRSVEVRNSTHLVSFCGPKDDPKYLESLEENEKFVLIKGYPKSSCHTNKHNYIHQVLEGEEFFVIPRLHHPEILTTKVELSGIFLRGFNLKQNESIVEDFNPEDKVLAVRFGGIPMNKVSFSFDIRVTGEDTVTSNLYRFVYGNPQSVLQLYPSGSSFDLNNTSHLTNELNSSTTNSDNWPVSPSEYSWCSACAPGRFSVGVDTLECALCPPGHYSPKGGSSGCLPCPQGTFSYTWGSQICRPCMIGSAAHRPGSEYCQLCPEGYMTDREGAAHCTVSVKSTKIHTDYTVVASFGVVLNGTSLQQVERLGTGVHASGLMILKTLIRTDMADALNISIDDVIVTNVSAFGKRALLVNIETSFGVEVAEDADPEELHDEIERTKLKGDKAVEQLIGNPDDALKRTTGALDSHAKVNSSKTRVVESKESEHDPRGHWSTHPAFALFSLVVFVVCFTLLCYLRHKRRAAKRTLPKQYSWEEEDLSLQQTARQECQLGTFNRIRYRTIAPHSSLNP